MVLRQRPQKLAQLRLDLLRFDNFNKEAIKRTIERSRYIPLARLYARAGPLTPKTSKIRKCLKAGYVAACDLIQCDLSDWSEMWRPVDKVTDQFMNCRPLGQNHPMSERTARCVVGNRLSERRIAVENDGHLLR